ncbi:MAG: NTP transferase domain-containing protein [Alphaproteobacteria bacterium]|nr:NTP transferase domain-containing protein [Alphaproteobacteria bacterium]MBU1515037.1 NTP transferase domain-containing protein [Alphaproteobacteria bacterium]MBU2095686.1 NTP transferase domain-containing protein [Alphaproteobacteria bacterium]MBU2152819.1 NTP transferase domain-containing protein [Alphaproteobacteria bacterium]MBU2306873.1 NTP transferase domain-containing protein [Alphaproteobacteria bacterium]
MSPPDAPPFTAIVLAAQRAGRVDPLAADAGVANKSLVAIAGAPLIRHVVEALFATPGLSRVRIVVEPQTLAAIQAILPRGPAPVDFVDAADNLADSVYAAAAGVDQPMLVTTSDNVLLTPGAVLAVLAPLAAGADVTLALATQAAVLAAHPEGQRRFYRFSDEAYSNCNLYALGGISAMRVAESFRSGGQFAKKPLRMIVALGPITLALMLMKQLSVRGALRRLARRFRLTVEPVILADGAHAIDVDNARTYACAEMLLTRRREALAA